MRKNRSAGSRLSALESLEARLLFSETATASPVLLSTTGSGASAVYNYDITLKDTGTTPIGTLWYAWVPGEDFMKSMPTAISGPTGWAGVSTGGGTGNGFAVQWIASGTPLAAGQTLTGFKFSSNDSPTALAGNSSFYPTTPTGTSFVYSAGPFSDAGYQFVAKPAIPASLVVTAPAAQTATAGTSKSITLGSFTATGTTAPYAVDVNWGDGSADTKFSLTATGTITTQAHSFAKAATDTVTVSITDAASHASNKATFKVTVSPAPQSITGTVFSDANANGKLDTGEKGLAGVKVYIDANKSGAFVTGDTSVTTNSAGVFTFANVASGTYRIREVLPTGYVETAPTVGYFDAVLSGKGATGLLFADALSTANITGTVFGDTNADGKIDDHEVGLGLWQVYIDTNKDGKLETTEKVVTTDINGRWSFTGLIAGTYTIRVVPVSGDAATKPTGGVLTVVVMAEQASTGNLFGEQAIS